MPIPRAISPASRAVTMIRINSTRALMRIKAGTLTCSSIPASRQDLIDPGQITDIIAGNLLAQSHLLY